MKYTIYKITNKINNKSYIGFTRKKIEKRFKEHLYESHNENSNGYNYLLHKAIRKYGDNNFDIIELFKSWDKNYCLNEMENYFINEYRTFVGFEDCFGYNQTLGGQAAMLDKKHSEDSKNKMRINHKHQKPWLNKKHSEDSKNKMKESRKNLPNKIELSVAAGKISQQKYKKDPERQKKFSERMKLWWKERKELEVSN